MQNIMVKKHFSTTHLYLHKCICTLLINMHLTSSHLSNHKKNWVITTHILIDYYDLLKLCTAIHRTLFTSCLLGYHDVINWSFTVITTINYYKIHSTIFNFTTNHFIKGWFQRFLKNIPVLEFIIVYCTEN